MSSGRCVPWMMHPMKRHLDTVSLGRCVPWTKRHLDTVFLGRCVPVRFNPYWGLGRDGWRYDQVGTYRSGMQCIVQRMHSLKDASSKRRIVQGTNHLRYVRPRTHHPKDVSSQGRIDPGTFQAMFLRTLIIPGKYSRLIFPLIRSSKLCKLSLDFLHFYI